MSQPVEIKKKSKKQSFQESNTSDPWLQKWCTKIQTLINNGIKKPKEKDDLHAMVVECVHLFSKQEYYDDIALVKIRIKYAFLEHTLSFLNSFYAKGVGGKSAIMYLTMAECNIFSENYHEANQCFEKGIKANAQPKSLLEEAQQHFLLFLGRKTLNPDEVFKSTMNLDCKSINEREPNKEQRDKDQESSEPVAKKTRLDESIRKKSSKKGKKPSQMVIQEETIKEDTSEADFYHGEEFNTPVWKNWAEAEWDSQVFDERIGEMKDFITGLSDNESSEDLLAPWCKCLNKLEEDCQTEQNAAPLYFFLEYCCIHFKNNEQYQNDERFVNICIKFAYQDHGLANLARGFRDGLGLSCVEMYIALAEKFAINNYLKKANEIYEKGFSVTSDAKSKKLLEEARQNFLLSVGRKTLNENENFQSFMDLNGNLDQITQLVDEPEPDKTSEEPPDVNRSTATFRYTVTNVSRLTNKGRLSEPCYVRNLPWQIMVEKRCLEKKKYIRVSLVCNKEMDMKSWRCSAAFTLTLLSQKGGKNYCLCTGRNIFPSLSGSGWGYSISWEAVCDPSYEYIKNDEMIIEAFIAADVPETSRDRETVASGQ